MNATARAPSHLTSNSQSAPRGLRGRRRARAFRGAFPGRPAALPNAIRGARGLPFALARRQFARNLFLRASGEHAVRVRLHVPARLREFVALLDQQPLVSLAAALHVDDREIALELFAVKPEFQIAARQLLGPARLAEQLERAAVP